MNIFQAILLAIIEGLTEFLPISSTGHLIIGSSLIGVAPSDFSKLFIVAIQLGTILSVVVLYFKRFFQSIDFYTKLFVAFIPSAILGVLLSDKIDSMLESPMTVAITLVLGGIILLFVDKWFQKATYEDSKDIDYLTALKIGFFQCLAMIPGMSRSGATIVGGMSQKLSRKAAAEFSFFLAVPTMFGATAKKLYDFYSHGHSITAEELNILLIGNFVGFLVAIIAIKSFIGFLNRHGFKIFGIYRIVVGSLLIALLALDYNLQII
ncbi:MAG: undecaprenyl-diphosphate phosphatase [Chitinophagales bacterium]|nr:undecaprenyl-diphosphate phosphatase [Chitinophagales bacterium]MCZ2394467.1 undecaprenyl-diphosphate phosphatase [Chitinophagales bacterium]